MYSEENEIFWESSEQNAPPLKKKKWRLDEAIIYFILESIDLEFIWNKLEKANLHEHDKQCNEDKSRSNMYDECNVDEEILDEMDIRSKEFKSWREAYEMSKKYGRMKGFGVRLHNDSRNKEKQIILRNFVCSSEDFQDKRYQENPNRKRKQRNLTRSGCKASMRLHLKKERSECSLTADVAQVKKKQQRFVDNDAMAVLSYLRGKAESDPQHNMIINF
ncbi:protein FAR1-RELATED SEQUENCE 5-like [Senna tora]|uniref:Protein FAR1-RELATED SEQUENCE 5-like n=1 Tax=Senna tora TaxID=362788 RepID=A0A834W6C6_9FABA|nr:protein FAR1-RELATED SEQUENCE 5-like [Senna tora]